MEHGSYDISRDRPIIVGSSVLSDKDATVHTTFLSFFRNLPRLIRHWRVVWHIYIRYISAVPLKWVWTLMSPNLLLLMKPHNPGQKSTEKLSFKLGKKHIPRNVRLTVVKMRLGPSKTCRTIRVVVRTVVEYRINRGEMHRINMVWKLWNYKQLSGKAAIFFADSWEVYYDDCLFYC